MSELLKISKARDDEDFKWRVTAAMMVYSHKAQFFDLGPEARQLCTWVLANPMVPQPVMINFVCTDPSILEFVKMNDNKWSAESVPDQTIVDVVDAKWTDVSRSMYGETPPVQELPA